MGPYIDYGLKSFGPKRAIIIKESWFPQVKLHHGPYTEGKSAWGKATPSGLRILYVKCLYLDMYL